MFSGRCWCVCVWGGGGAERLWWWLHPYVWLSSIILLLWLPGFPPLAFPTTISSLTPPPSISPQSTAALALGLLHKPYAPAPSCCPFQGTCVPVWDMYCCGRDYLILIPLRLPQISCLIISLKCYPSDSDNCPNVGITPLLQFPAAAPSRRPTFLPGICMALTRTVWFSFHLGCHRSAVSLSALNVSPLTQIIAPLWGSDRASVPPPTEGRSTPTPVFPPSSFILLSFAWFYIFFSTGQVALFALSWCSACVLCLMVHSWCIREERCTPRPPTPLPSCPPV